MLSSHVTVYEGQIPGTDVCLFVVVVFFLFVFFCFFFCFCFFFYLIFNAILNVLMLKVPKTVFCGLSAFGK